MKKIAICFYGIHYLENYKHWMGWDINIDYRKTIQTYIDNIEEYFIKEYEIEYYFSTYKTKIIDELVETFNPKKYKAQVYVDSDKIEDYSKFKKDRLREVIEMVDDVDIYLILRFDLLFKMNFSKLAIDLNKINFNCRMKPYYGENDVDDNIFLFPSKLKNTFMDAINRHDDNRFLHDILNYLNIEDVNFFLDEKLFSHELSLYQISR